MQYISTRGGGEPVAASHAILHGLAHDGGLYVPEALPTMDMPLSEWMALSYTDLAQAIMKPFLGFSDVDLASCATKAYAPIRFDDPHIAPLVSPAGFAGVHFLELFHGPTLAFKDMALSILPHMLRISTEKEGQAGKIVILTATSGDTGKAALEAFRDAEGVSIVVFYPEKGVSPMQKRQMVTQEGDNTFVFGVQGNFDDAQTGVKNIFSDAELTRTMAEAGIMFSSANSINIGRLLPQVVYYY
jgi:threonine synthase